MAVLSRILQTATCSMDGEWRKVGWTLTGRCWRCFDDLTGNRWTRTVTGTWTCWRCFDDLTGNRWKCTMGHVHEAWHHGSRKQRLLLGMHHLPQSSAFCCPHAVERHGPRSIYHQKHELTRLPFEPLGPEVLVLHYHSHSLPRDLLVPPPPRGALERSDLRCLRAIKRLNSGRLFCVHSHTKCMDVLHSMAGIYRHSMARCVDTACASVSVFRTRAVLPPTSLLPTTPLNAPSYFSSPNRTAQCSLPLLSPVLCP